VHDLRHVHATTLHLAGEPVYVVAARLGHADPCITLRVYMHVIQELTPAIADSSAPAVSEAAKSEQKTAKRPAASRRASKSARGQRRATGESAADRG
jgi:hypothetical protein